MFPSTHLICFTIAVSSSSSGIYIDKHLVLHKTVLKLLYFFLFIGNISDDVDSFESLPEPIARRRIEPMSLICHRTGIMGKFLNRYSPFLSPCVIAYSLISSGKLSENPHAYMLF